MMAVIKTILAKRIDSRAHTDKEMQELKIQDFWANFISTTRNRYRF